MSLGQRLRELRKAENKTLKTAASELKIAPITLSNYERDERKPKLKTMEKLSGYYGVSTDYLIKGKEAAEEKEDDFDVARMFYKDVNKRIKNAIPHEVLEEKILDQAFEAKGNREAENMCLLVKALLNDFRFLKTLMQESIGKEITNHIFERFPEFREQHDIAPDGAIVKDVVAYTNKIYEEKLGDTDLLQMLNSMETKKESDN